MANIHLPYQFIEGLPEEAQRQIWRDFMAVIQGIISVPGFDAIIDPAFPSDANAHRYKNLTDLATTEKWAVGQTLHVGVALRADFPVIETTTPDMSLHGDIEFTGLGAPTHAAGSSTVAHWQWRSVTSHSDQSFRFTNLNLSPTLGGQRVGSTSNVFPTFVNCYGNSNFQPGDSSMLAIDCTFDAAVTANQSGSTSKFLNCTQNAGITVSGNNSLVIYGGRCSHLSFSGNTCVVYTDLSNSNVTVGSSLGAVQISNLGATGGALTVSGVSNSSFYGPFGGVTLVAGSVNSTNYFHGSANGILDVTNQWHIVAQVNGGTLSPILLRGDSIRAELQGKCNSANPVLKLIGVTDSLITIDFRNPGIGPGLKAYDIDAASARCLIIAGGSRDPDFSVAPTNAGTNCLVIDELGAPPSGAASGSLAGTYPSPTFAGRDSSVDKINQDMLPSLLVEAFGVQVIPIPAPGSAPTGPAGGSLSGTYPNPAFAGRDTSFDKMDQDILMGNLGIGTATGMLVQAAPAVPTVDFSQIFLLMGG